MRFLLDTSIFLWSLDPSRPLSTRVQEIFTEGEEIHLSAASAWEIVVKYRLRKLQLPMPPTQLIPDSLTKYSINALSVTLAHTLAGEDLPNHHRDPFDRILIAQAIAEGMVLLTEDSEIARYPVQILWCGK